MTSPTKILGVVCVLAVACGTPTSRSFQDDIRPDDTVCLRETEQAFRDVAEHQLCYCDYFGLGVEPLRAENELKAALERLGIGYRYDDVPCVVREGFEDNCYCQVMHEQITKKYGEGFLDSLRFVADSLYVLAHPEAVYECTSYNTCWDLPARYPGDTTLDRTNHSGLQVAFNQCVNYPTDYRTKSGVNSMAQLKAYVFVDEHGNAEVTNTECIFWDSETKEEDFNKLYWNYLGQLADSLIEGATWVPATIKSVPVKSRTELFVYFL